MTISIAVPRALFAQTLATGDSRTVNQPTLPAVCQTLNAQFTSSQRSSPPSTDDTSRIQAALTSCAGSGKSVVLAASGSNNAFYSNLLTVNGEGLVINSGVTLFGNNSYASQKELILVKGANSSLMGPGTVDGRGDIVSGSARLVQATNITNFTVFNVTLTQARHPNLYVEGGNGFTAWGVTIRTPANRSNADGIDIDSMTNATVINSSVNAGDDGIAVKTNSGPASNMTIKNSRFFGTHGISVGSQTFNGVTNILFTGNYIYGVDLNGIAASDANAIRVKSDVTCGGLVKQVTYTNTCITKAKHLIVLDTMYGSCSGTAGTPNFQDIVINGVLSTSSVSGAYTRIRGLDSSHLINAFLAHVSLDATTQSSDQDAMVVLDASNITPSGSGIATSSFTISGSVPTCTF
ncbi:MAG TPA: glycosyl hydrolase family 28 protein [Kofleriaceae bacterium]|nr:glycosyl hydrolase family 28 protein [Kofleriaceae bacterium]